MSIVSFLFCDDISDAQRSQAEKFSRKNMTTFGALSLSNRLMPGTLPLLYLRASLSGFLEPFLTLDTDSFGASTFMSMATLRDQDLEILSIFGTRIMRLTKGMILSRVSTCHCRHRLTLLTFS